MAQSDTILLVLRISLSLLCSILNGIDLSFNVYAVLLKETFNFTQTQVEIVASMASTGFGLAFLESILTGVSGYTTTFVVTWIGVPLSSALIFLATVYRDYFYERPLLLYLFQLCLYTGNGVVYMAVTRLCLEIAPANHTGTFIGLFGTGLCFGKIVFAGMFDLFFKDNLGGFFLCLSVMFAVVLGLCYVLLYPVAMKLEQKIHNSTNSNDKNEYDGLYTDVAKSPFFHMTFWTTVVFSAAALTILHNITSITDSLGMRDPFAIVTTMSICIMTTRFLFAFIFNKIGSQTCGFMLLFLTYLSFGAGLLIGMYFLNSTLIHVLTVLAGIGIGPAFYLPLAMLVAQFGRCRYSFMSSSLLAIMSFCQFILQILVGVLYDSTTDQMKTEGHYCYGTECFFWTYVALLMITLVALMIQVTNFFLTLYCPSHIQDRVQ